jgi:hypothetical protein
LADKVNTYVTVIGAVVALVNVSFIVADAPLPVFGVMPVTAARVQLNAVPDVALVAV